MLFDGFDTLIRTVITAVLTYGALVVLLRFSGKRTLAKWNAFDLVVTIAFGSVLASALLSSDTTVVQAVVALASLIGLQYIVTRSSVLSRRLERLVKARPTVLLYRGELLTQVMKRERVTTPEVLAAVRSAGIGELAEVAAVVLENDGSFSVIPAKSAGDETTLSDVDRAK